MTVEEEPGSLNIQVESISRVQKDRFLLSLSEDAFRDRVVRPLFLRQGLKDGRELCGPSEEGKDTLFVSTDELGMHNIYEVQTKKGSINLAGKANKSLVTTITQLRTALETTVVLLEKRQKVHPTKVFLCASGAISDSARRHILDEVKDERIVFLDRDDLVPKIDEHLPELWLGIEAELTPYLRAVIQAVDDSSNGSSRTEVLPSDVAPGAATDTMFVPLQVHRTTIIVEKSHGQTRQVPKHVRIPLRSLLRRSSKNILLLGEAGAGKSTCMRRLAYTIAKDAMANLDDFKIPIILRATGIWRNNERSLIEACLNETKRMASPHKPAFSVQHANDGRLIVLIDALDELPDDPAREAVLELVSDFCRDYPDCLVVVSSRDYAFVKTLVALTRYEHWYIDQIDFRQAEQILERLQKNKPISVESRQEIMRRLQEVHGMELNPLLVTVFAATSDYSRRDIPANITELFKKYTEMMLGRWDASKGLDQQFYAPLKDFILRKVAYEMHSNRLTTLGVAEFRLTVQRELATRGYEQDVDALTDEMLVRSGLFRQIGDSVEFRHMLLQEFFAGRGIPESVVIDTIVSDDWWQRAIVFHFGEHPDNSADLLSLTRSLSSASPMDTYQSAVTLGLALQACYLVELPNKVPVFCAVVDALADVKAALLGKEFDVEKHSLKDFLGYYLFARDSVACQILESNQGEIEEHCSDQCDGIADADARTFWLIVGLIEAGLMDSAEKMIKAFHPSDPRFLLAIHMGCFLMQHTRAVSREQRKTAARINEKLVDDILPLRSRLLQEVTSELLEVRRGEIVPLELPSPSLPAASQNESA